MNMNPRGILATTTDGCLRAFSWAGLFSLCINLLMLTVSLYTWQIFDHVIASQSRDTLTFLTILAVGAVAVLGFLELVRSRILVGLSVWIEQRLAPEAFERGIAATLHARTYRSEALRDLGRLRSFLGGSGIFSLFDAPWVPIYLAVAFLLHPLVGLVALSGAVVLFFFAILNEILTRAPLQRANQAAFGTMQQAEASLRNAEAIDAMGMMPGVVATWTAANGRALDQQSVASNRAGSVLALTSFCAWRCRSRCSRRALCWRFSMS